MGTTISIKDTVIASIKQEKSWTGDICNMFYAIHLVELIINEVWFYYIIHDKPNITSLDAKYKDKTKGITTMMIDNLILGTALSDDATNQQIQIDINEFKKHHQITYNQWEEFKNQIQTKYY